jgi:hypothetical protein
MDSPHIQESVTFLMKQLVEGPLRMSLEKAPLFIAGWPAEIP